MPLSDLLEKRWLHAYVRVEDLTVRFIAHACSNKLRNSHWHCGYSPNRMACRSVGLIVYVINRRFACWGMSTGLIYRSGWCASSSNDKWSWKFQCASHAYNTPSWSWIFFFFFFLSCNIRRGKIYNYNNKRLKLCRRENKGSYINL